MPAINRKIKRQRSSLKVNLSCTSNLADSDYNTPTDTSVGCSTDDIVSHKLPLKNLSIVLERITKDNATLSKNCESLKEIIIAKTNEIFDKQDELSLKTSEILNTKSNRSDKLTRSNIECITVKKKILASDIPNKVQCGYGKHKHESTNEHERQTRSRSTDISKDESYFTALPIGCSTMINDSVQETCSQTECGLSYNCHEYTENLCDDVRITDITQIENSSLNKIPKTNPKTVCQVSCTNTKKTLNNDSLNADTSSSLTQQTSLKVNTSIDIVLEKSKYTCNQKWINDKKKKRNKLENEPCDVEKIQENTNATCASLQMNTSLDVSNGLKNINDTMKKGAYNSHNTQSNNSHDPNTENYKVQSCVEIGSESDENEIFNNNANDKEYNTTIASTSLANKIDKSKSGIDQNVKCSTTHPDKAKRKKKLLPLRECSQLVSFSPVQNECLPPLDKVHKKKRKIVKTKLNKRDDNNRVVSEQCTLQNSEGTQNKDVSGKKKKQKPRKIISKKIVVKKIIDEDIFNKLNVNNEDCNKVNIEIGTPQRISSNDFQSLKKISIVHAPKKQVQRINIVVTGYSNEDKNLVKKVTKVLGFANIQSCVTKSTTHVVTTGVRTINLLHGIIRGCWLVSLEWVLKSLENNTWIDPENYELAHFSKAVVENRKDRQLFGKSYIPELFATCGCIYVKSNTTPPSHVLKSLVKAAGGNITENQECAKILIGEEGLRETWILDCITSGELQPCSHYKC